jgi:hypothetical protein
MAAALAVPLLCAAPLGAQGVCDGRPIRDIQIDVRTIFSSDDSLIPRFVRRVGNAIHWQTREETVRRDLLFAVGDPCDPRRLSETERLLRARGYIRSAIVVPIATADGGVSILVLTRDEFSLEVRARVQTGGEVPVRRFILTEDNILGRGIRAQGYYNSFGRRSAVYGDVLEHHFLDRRIEAELMGGKSEVGLVGEEGVRRAFESEFDRVAWRESVRYRKEPFPLVSTALGTVLQPTVRLGADVGAAGRIGVPGQLLIVGAVLSYDRALAEGAPLAPTADLDSTAAAQLAGRFAERRRARAHLLLGVRHLNFRAHHGVDAVRALEDVPKGAQAGLVLGKSLFGGWGLEHDWFAAAEFLAGADLSGRGLVFARAKVEGRYLTSARRWDGVIASGQMLLYNIGPNATTVLAVRADGGWSTATPFQLLLGGQSGIRGYGDQTLPVGRRVMVHGEHRYYLGGVFGFADVGTSAFAEAGRGWAGDAVFGENTGLLATVGVGLRFAVPRGSRRTYRLDIAFPLRGGRGLELRLGVRQQFGVFSGEPDDVARSRERISSVTVFDFPRF